MSEQIRILDRNNPSILIFEAMVKGTKREDMLDTFNLRPGGDDTVAQVEMLVNGVPVPVVKTLEHYFKLFDDQVEERAAILAKEMVTSLGLEKIRDHLSSLETAMQGAEWCIESAINEWTSKNV